MAFLVEDGTVVSNANSYISAADANTYLADRGSASSEWNSASTAAREALLIRATQYIDESYDWIGYLVETTQPLNWPRLDAYDSDWRDYNRTIPDNLKNAVAEMANWIAANGDPQPNIARSNYTKREKVGSIEIEYQDGAPAETDFPFVSKLLRRLTISGGSNRNEVNLVRS